MSMMNKVAQEHVDSAIEKRPFNMMAFSPAGEAMVNSVPGMKDQVAQANANAAAISRMQQDVRRSSSGGQAGGWGANTPKSSNSTPGRSGGWNANTPKSSSSWGN